MFFMVDFKKAKDIKGETLRDTERAVELNQDTICIQNYQCEVYAILENCQEY